MLHLKVCLQVLGSISEYVGGQKALLPRKTFRHALMW